ncbi:MAG: PduL/EutD family phosphate acyltransferase [Candidatus Uhrbacteria bacterium]
MRRKKILIPIEVIPHHVHLSQRMWQTLFGKNISPKILRPLSQRGQAVYQQTVKVVGPKGEMTEVRVLGGARKQTQVELSEAEAIAIGIKPVWRVSGKLSRTVGCKLIGPAGKAVIKSGVIVPVPHLHLNTKEAESLDLRQGQEIELSFFEDKAAKLKVLVRVHPSFRAALHITPDVAAKLWLSISDKAIL